MKSSHVLELNGKRYDALSGKLLSNSAPASQPDTKSVDGFVKPVQRGVAATAHHHGARPSTLHRSDVPLSITHHTPSTPAKVFDVSRGAPHHTRPHKLQHSETLMRHVVHRPDASLKRRTKPVPHTSTLVKAVHFDVTPKYSVSTVDEDRLKRAKTIARSRLISRFASMHPSLERPAAQPKPAPVQPLPYAAPSPTPHVTRQPSTDIFERALAAANSHKQPYAPVRHAKKSHRLRHATSIAASSLAILLIIGFVAYQNVATIQLRLASSQAGINATLPAWQPSGFTIGTFTHGPGSVTISFNSKTSPSSYSIAQTASNWDSSTLLSDYVYPNNETYNTISSNGSTIYTYGDNNATWVNGGIWYKLTSNGSLSTSQIVNIATSM